MTELADGVAYSRSGLTYQAGLLEKASLITRGPSPDDDRATLVTITDSGRARLGRVMPATSRSPAACCSSPCPRGMSVTWATS
jgi:DNA-binding MarR family transcriptional regulator